MGPWALQDQGVSTLLDGKGTSTRRHPARPKTALVGAHWAIPYTPGPACPPQVWRTGLTLGFLPRSPVPAWVTRVWADFPSPPLPTSLATYCPHFLFRHCLSCPCHCQIGQKHSLGVFREGEDPILMRAPASSSRAQLPVLSNSSVLFFGSCWFTGELPLSQAPCPPRSPVAFPYGPRVLGACLLCLAEGTGRRTVFQGW